MNYEGYDVKNDIVIDKIYTVHYFEFFKDYVFPGETHGFWELLYVDKGEVICEDGREKLLLKRGDMVLHKPDKWHSMRSDGINASNIAVITFSCDTKCISSLAGRVIPTDYESRRLIARIVEEYSRAFVTPLNDVHTGYMVPADDVPIGSAQLIVQYICELLIMILRRDIVHNNTGITYNRLDTNASVNALVEYMRDNITRMITMDELASVARVNTVTVNRLFTSQLSITPMKYFIRLKVEEAKKHLRENNYNVTQISEILGYANVHYFSKQFKKETGMSPTEYVSSVKALNDAWSM